MASAQLMLHKYLDNEGNMKPHCVTGDNGIEHDHKQAMALHKWNKPKPTIFNGQHVTMRVGTPSNSGQEMQVTCGVTILHSSITMTVGTPAEQQ
eukprot:4825800-Amphidinium_carterae.1